MKFGQSEIVVDSFAGGGGASTGIHMALGYPPHVAINHDDAALAMHAANHPDTVHLSNNIWKVDPDDVERGRPIGLFWASPDCTHHSKAKGGVPIRSEGRNSRDLGWIVVLWAQRRRPRVIILENVEEWQQWGPLVADGNGDLRPDPERKGQTFKAWVRQLRGLGYRVEWQERRACDFGAPTIRKRLLVIARCDGRSIVWPAPTHGDPKSEAVKSGRLKPWRTAAEIIDWTLPCPSIFMTRDEAKAYHKATGVRVNRPLAEATMARIARGVKRYVLDAAEPFIIRTDMASAAARNGVNGIDEPIRTQTTAGSHAVVTPFVAPFVSYGQQGGANRSAEDPMHTITASEKDTNAVVAPFLVPRYGERPGQEPRSQPIDGPLSTIVPTGNGATLVAPVMVKNNFGDKPFSAADEPLRTICTGNNHMAVAAFLAKHYGDTGQRPGSDLAEPVSTITAQDHHSLVAAHMLNLKGSDRRAGPIDAPAPTFTGQGNHAALVSAFLIKYYGAGIGAHLTEPMHTDTTRDRFGLVTVNIAGEPYVIVDIGMRMLTARERFLAQGFPADYRIDIEFDGKPLSGEAKGRMVGNSVCPPFAEAHVRANCPDLARVQ